MAGAPDPAVAAAEQIAAAAQASTVVGAPGASGPLPAMHFDRLGIERRVLGHITDEVDYEPLGPRNTLAALTYALMHDPNTTNPPPGLPRLDVAGKTVAEVAQLVLGYLKRLVDAGLVKDKGGQYALTAAGRDELGG